jgi:foldase protein PrsA
MTRPSTLIASLSHARRVFAASALLVLLAFVVASCGGGVPSNGVATVGDEVITKKEFNHWLNAAAKGQAAQAGPGGAAAVPDAPEFKKCIAGKKKTPTPKGTPKPKDADLKKQCQQEYDALRQQVMQFLISAEWIQQEADARGIKTSDKEVQKEFQDQKKQSFPKEKDYQEFLKTSGQTESDLLFRVKLDVLSNQVREKVTQGKDKVSDKEITDYYNKNKSRFATPETRDLNVVLTEKEPEAKKAMAALKDGQSFKTVAKKYSIDEASKSQGGKLPAVAKGQQEKALDQAVFKAKKGELTGPVKTQFGYYVFEVTKVTKANQQSLEESKESIRAQLKSQKEQGALDKFVKSFQDKYRKKTECGDDYKKGLEQQCGNLKKPKGNATQSPQGAPGQGQAPPQTGGAPPQTGGAPPQTGGAPPQTGGAPPQQVPPSAGGSGGQAPPSGAPGAP